MNNKNDHNKLKREILSASRWSAITEILSKLTIPVTNMILARILVPEAFGVIITITMITSFVDMFLNTGFQKYLIQHEFKNEEEKKLSISVAFWANLVLSVFFWLIIFIFSTPIAKILGDANLSLAISIASLQIVISSFSSIQLALYRREFNFKTLFIVRMITAFVPMVITIPLALFGLGYWSLIIGAIMGQLISASLMTIKSTWKPRFIFSFIHFRKMMNYSIWSTVDALALWLESWIDAFVVGSIISTYYLGIYKTSLNTVNGLFAVVTSSVAPVLFSALSRYQKDETMFKKTFILTQKTVAYLLLPLGIGIYIYSDLVTTILLGPQWSEAGEIIGIWALSMSFITTIANFNSDAFRSVGRPDVSFVVEVITTIVVVIACLISVEYGFWALVYTKAIITFVNPLISYIAMKKYVNIGFIDVFEAIKRPFICSIIMGMIAYVLKLELDSSFGNIVGIIISVFAYCISVFLISKEDFYNLVKLFYKKV